MRDGDPFETEDLDRLRAEQRPALTALLDLLPPQSRPRQWDASNVKDRARVETHARQLAQGLLQKHKALLDRARESAEAARWKRFMDDEAGRDLAPTLLSARDRIVDNAWDDCERRRGPRWHSLDEAQRADLDELVLLLVMADRLANTG